MLMNNIDNKSHIINWQSLKVTLGAKMTDQMHGIKNIKGRTGLCS